MPALYFVRDGRELRHDGYRYPAGAEVPASRLNSDALRRLSSPDGCLRKAEVSASAPPVETPKPEAVKPIFVHPDWDPTDPTTVSGVPVRVIPALLASLDEGAVEAVKKAEEGAAQPRKTVLRHCNKRLAEFGG